MVNHTSDEHPWFVDARSDPGSRYRDWCVWSVDPPNPASHSRASGTFANLLTDPVVVMR